MKKTAALLVLMMLCLFGLSAAAELNLPAQMVVPENDRVRAGLPEGMVYESVSVSNGVMHIVIDTDRTDWDMVATAARKSGSLVIHPGIDKPNDAIGCLMSSDYYRWESESSSSESEARILGGFNADMQRNPSRGYSQDSYACSYQGWAIGRFDEGTGLFIPEAIPSAQGAGFSAYWKMNDGTYRAERVRFTVGYTKMPPVYVKRQGVHKNDIVMNVNTGGSGMAPAGSVTETKKETGRISYTLTNEAAGKEVFTAVAVPSWINGTDVQAFLLSNGKETPLQLNDMYIPGRKSAVLFYKLSKADCLYKKDWAIKWTWKNPAREVQTAIRYLEAEFCIGDPKLTVTYAHDGEAGAEPLPASSLTWQISNPLNGLGVSYEDGVFHMSIDQRKLPANRKTDLCQTRVTGWVMPPADAARCVVSMYRGDVIYGNNGESAWKLGELEVTPGEKFSVPELTGRMFFNAVPAMLHNGKQIRYYVAPLMVGKHGGETLVFEWIDANNKRIGKRQYVALTSDAYQVTIEVNESQTMNPTAAVTKPMVLADADLDVETAELPQMGENIMRYEIALLDTDGNKAQPDGPVVLYLPYPDEKSMEDFEGYTFTVYHELSGGGYEEYSTANGKLELTDVGLRMEVTSFSPYFLNWEEAADASGLPETGDSSSIVPYVLALAICALGTVALKKRRYGMDA